MLENKILSNQSFSDSKRDSVINQSNQTSTDRKFEDAMYESRQQQLNAEQRQNAAKNDLAQQQREQQQRQQEQIKSRQESERSASAERTPQPKNANPDDRTPVTNDVKRVNSTEADNKTVEKDDVNNSSEDSSLSTSSVLEQALTDSASDPEQAITDESTSEPILESDTEVDSPSWLDTFMKIVGHNEQHQKSTEQKNQSLEVQSLEVQSETDSVVKGDVDTTKTSDVLTNFLFGTDSFSADDVVTEIDNITSVANEDESDIESNDLTSLLTDKVMKDVVKTDESVNTEVATVDGESDEQDEQQDIPSLLNKGDGSASNDDVESASILDEESDTVITSAVVNALGTDVNKDSDASDEDINILQKGTPVFTSSVLQQQMQQEQSIDNSKQPNLLEQSTKASTVLNFVNPVLSELSKRQNTDGVESNQFSTDFDDELDGIKTNADGANTNDKKLDSELKSILDIKNASLLASGIDGNNKTAEPANKTDVVDVNGVQLDKSLQLPKLEHASQAKNEVMLRENILFNKQEMATHMQQQIGIMMSKNMKSIDIRLDPPELGAMQIKLTMNNDQAAVSFVVSNQQAKDALEASLPKLRELLEQQGMDLAESDVQHGNGQGETESQDDSDARSNGNGMSNDDGQEEANLIAQEKLNRAINSPWNVDYYA